MNDVDKGTEVLKAAIEKNKVNFIIQIEKNKKRWLFDTKI